MIDDEKPLPTGMELSMLNPEFRNCPDHFYDRLRGEAPVYQDRGCDRVVLARAQEIGPFLNDRSLSADPRKARPTSLLRIALGVTATFRPNLAFMDDPDHKRIRALIAAEFSPASLEALRPEIVKIAEQLLEMVQDTSRFDVMEVYAKPLPTITIGLILGIDGKDQKAVKNWSDTVLLRFDPKISKEQRAELDRAKSELRSFLSLTIKDKLERPGVDLISKLLDSNRKGEIEELEILELCEFLMVAGNLTTTDLIGNAVFALLSNPNELLKLMENPGLTSDMVEETLRLDPPVTAANRVTTSSRTLAGVPIEEGQNITALLMSANHDPELHPDPLSFSIDRPDKKHYSFGGGSHYCIGAGLARLEAEIAIPLLFRRFPYLTLLSETPPERKPIPSSSGWNQLWVRAFPE